MCNTKGMNYQNSTPKKDRIKLVNKLFDEGHTIYIDSARGSGTGEYWTQKTHEQLKKWGLKYHKLRCGYKFAADEYIDDKGFNSENWFKC